MPYYKRLRFEVEDTGIGIAPDAIEKIFAPFEQLQQTHLYSEGTGLGLAISQRLVRMMGSELHVESTFGKGSTFWFDLELPEVKDAGIAEKNPVRSIVGFQGKACTILLVDDKVENRSVLKDLLLPLGFDILEAVDGREAISKAFECQPDLILMDLLMPVMDGYTATREIRKLETRNLKLETRNLESNHSVSSFQFPVSAHIPIIAISASVFEQARQNSITAGCQDFLPKPVVSQSLYDILQKHLDIEWIYADECAELQPKGGKLLAEEPVLSPPSETLSRLYKLAIIGDIMELRAQIETIDPIYEPFIDKIRTLAKELNILEIQKLLKQYIEEEDEHEDI
jgi:CheY-like chemotaxis protein